MRPENPVFTQQFADRVFALDGTVLTTGHQHFFDQLLHGLDDEVFQI